MPLISPDRWRSFAAALKALEDITMGDPADEVFEVIAEGRALLRAAGMVGEAPQILEKPKPIVLSNEVKKKRDQSKASGFTGDACSDCGEFKLTRVGTCIHCTNCGKSSGCG